MKNDNHIYGDDQEQLMKDYARLYLFGGGCLLVVAILALAVLVGVILWIKSILHL